MIKKGDTKSMKLMKRRGSDDTPRTMRRSVRLLTGATRAMSLVIAVMVIAFGAMMLSGSAQATPPGSSGNTEKYDFYTLSSNVSAYFSEAAKPGAKSVCLRTKAGQISPLVRAQVEICWGMAMRISPAPLAG